MKPEENQSLERILESAIVVSWGDLMRGAPTGLVQIEYGFAPKGTLDYLQIWSSISGSPSLLVCRYWMSLSNFHDRGIQFGNGYQSDKLAHILESVMQHQNSFALPPNLVGPGVLQIQTPTQAEGVAAAASVNEALACISSTPVQLAVA
jgi:hypothetical protein